MVTRTDQYGYLLAFKLFFFHLLYVNQSLILLSQTTRYDLALESSTTYTICPKIIFWKGFTCQKISSLSSHC